MALYRSGGTDNLQYDWALVKGIIRDIVIDLVWFMKTGACRYLHLFS